MTVSTKILAVRQETPMDRTFVLSIPAEAREAFSFVPGQFVVLRDPEGDPKRRRAYSISSAPGRTDQVEVTVRDMGTFGHTLYDLPVGKALRMRPPAGRFKLQHDAQEHLVLVAAGSGVTPFHSFLGHLDTLTAPPPTTLLQSAKHPGELIFQDEFAAFAAKHGSARYVPTVTRLAPDEAWDGRSGRIDAALVEAHVPDPKRTRFYACGPAPFVKSMLAAAEELGIPAEKRHKEQW